MGRVWDNHSELVDGYIKQFEEKYFKNRVVNRFKFSVAQEEIISIPLLPDAYLMAMSEAGRASGYQLDEYWGDEKTKAVVFVYTWVGIKEKTPKNKKVFCEHCKQEIKDS